MIIIDFKMYSNIHLQNLNQIISFSNGNILKVVDDFNIKSESESIFYNNISESTINQIIDIYLVSFNHYINCINLILDYNFDFIDYLDDSDIYNISENCNNIIFVLQKSNEGYDKFFKWCVEKKININKKYINQIKILLQELAECEDTVSAFENYKALCHLNNSQKDETNPLSSLINSYEKKTIIHSFTNYIYYINNNVMNFLFQED